MFCGVKTNYYTAGVDATTVFSTCDPEVYENSKVDSMLKWAQDAGKLTGWWERRRKKESLILFFFSTGLVTTTRITHATPSATYAHISDRDWECNGEIPEEYRSCIKDIATQLVEDSPGKDINVRNPKNQNFSIFKTELMFSRLSLAAAFSNWASASATLAPATGQTGAT